MKKIWKFKLAPQSIQTIPIPYGGDILEVALQYGEPHMWVLCDPENEKEDRYFETYGTGFPIDDSIDREHIGTYLLDDGMLVFHVFEVTQSYKVKLF